MHRPERSKPFGGAATGNVGNDAQDEEDEKPRTLFVGNVPREVHKREIEEVFGDIGPLKRCYIQYPRDGNGELVVVKKHHVCYDLVWGFMHIVIISNSWNFLVFREEKATRRHHSGVCHVCTLSGRYQSTGNAAEY